MGRSLTDEPEEPKEEQPEPLDILQMVYALGMYLQDIETKIDEMSKKLDEVIGK